MDLDAELGELVDSLPHIHGIAPKPVELGDDENVAVLQPVDQAGEAGDRAGDRLRHDPARLDLEAGRANLAELILGRLLDRRNAGIGKKAGHGGDQTGVYPKDLAAIAHAHKTNALCYAHSPLAVG